MSKERLPDFLVIGAYKSGTTTLHHALRAHPQLFLPSRKEPNFFAFEGAASHVHPQAGQSVRDLNQYLALFASAPADAHRGEVSPAYLAHTAACANIARRVPDARLIAVLRNPVERAYSDYLMYVRDGLEPHTDFHRALDEQDERKRKGLPTGHYVSTGFYATQLEPYLDRFGRDQVLVLFFEDLQADLARTLRTIFGFLGVDDRVDVSAHDPFNISGVPRSAATRTVMRLRRTAAPVLRPLVPPRIKHAVDRALQRRLERPPIPPSARARLSDIYRDDVARLEQLLRCDLTAWKTG